MTTTNNPQPEEQQRYYEVTITTYSTYVIRAEDEGAAEVEAEQRSETEEKPGHTETWSEVTATFIPPENYVFYDDALLTEGEML